MNEDPLWPPFTPWLLLPSGHLQTIFAGYLPAKTGTPGTKLLRVNLPDGDGLALHDDTPAAWREGDPVVLLVHGLGGSAKSRYLRRLAVKLTALGMRTCRLELRGVGAGASWSRGSYHAGRSADLAAAIEFIAAISPNSPLVLVGFSLAGNIVLKLLGELGTQLCGNLASGVAVCPPVDLSAASDRLSLPTNRFYNWYFARQLTQKVETRRRIRPDLHYASLTPSPRTLREFDARFTAIVGGFGDLETYYSRSSAMNLIPGITYPTLILAANDDPLIPIAPLKKIHLPENVLLHVCEHGGHLGFVAAHNGAADRYWMDWRILDWVKNQFDTESQA